MKAKYLVINAGSSSLKFSLYEVPGDKEIVNGCIEKIGAKDCFYTLKFDGKKVEKQKEINNHDEAVEVMLRELLDNSFISSVSEISGIGHRVLHGGEIYHDSVIIDDEVINNIDKLTKLGPLHHPGELSGINSLRKILPDAPEVAVFDTAFHQTMDEEHFLYAVPYSWYEENGVRKYGFHGTSHKYITEHMQDILGKKDVNLIICHIGNGASLSAIKDGKCIDTSMGLTPLEGVMMGTRSGSIDPSIIEYICKERNLSVEEVTDILNKESGLLGLTGKNDIRDIEEQMAGGDKNSFVAMRMYRKNIVKYIAEYYFELEGDVDALIFTAGAGESGINLRADIIDHISKPMNVRVNSERNSKIAKYLNVHEGVISTDDSAFPIFVIPTDEEYMILKDTYELTNGSRVRK